MRILDFDALAGHIDIGLPGVAADETTTPELPDGYLIGKAFRRLDFAVWRTFDELADKDLQPLRLPVTGNLLIISIFKILSIDIFCLDFYGHGIYRLPFGY